IGFCHTFLGPSVGHRAASGGPLYSPLRVGPRYCGQSVAMAPSVATPAHATRHARSIRRIEREDIRLGSFRADAVEMSVGPDKDRSVGHGDRREGVTIEPVAGQLAELVARLDHSGRSLFTQEIDPSVGIDRR